MAKWCASFSSVPRQLVFAVMHAFSEEFFCSRLVNLSTRRPLLKLNIVTHTKHYRTSSSRHARGGPHDCRVGVGRLIQHWGCNGEDHDGPDPGPGHRQATELPTQVSLGSIGAEGLCTRQPATINTRKINVLTLRPTTGQNRLPAPAALMSL